MARRSTNIPVNDDSHFYSAPIAWSQNRQEESRRDQLRSLVAT